MRIYSRKKFAMGIFLFLLGVCLLGMGVLGTFHVRKVICALVCITFGIIEISRAASSEKTREDLINECDERNNYIAMKTGKTTLSILNVVFPVFIAM